MFRYDLGLDQGWCSCEEMHTRLGRLTYSYQFFHICRNHPVPSHHWFPCAKSYYHSCIATDKLNRDFLGTMHDGALERDSSPLQTGRRYNRVLDLRCSSVGIHVLLQGPLFRRLSRPNPMHGRLNQTGLQKPPLDVDEVADCSPRLGCQDKG